MTTIKVLDHGHVRLFEHMGSDLSIVRNARVSYNAEWRAGEDAGKDEKLIRYLMANKHTSPFEAVAFTFDIKCPIFIARQWHRHRTWKYNEISARYAELPEEYYVPAPELIGRQSSHNKQVRELAADVDLAISRGHSQAIDTACRALFVLYRNLLSDGVPREIARTILPLATYTHFFATVDLHNLFHFLRLRLHSHAQFEIREYGKALLECIRPVVPVAVAAFEETLHG